MTKDRNDNKDSDRGKFYQALVAIKYALEINDFNTVTIEHLGDVTIDSKVQIEVKHHVSRNSLGNKDKEFWNTLYNWVIKPISYDQYVLHTTSHLPKDSIFKNWPNLTPEEKYSRICAIEFKINDRNPESVILNKLNLDILRLKGLKADVVASLTSEFGSYKKQQFVEKLKELQIDVAYHQMILDECESITAENIDSLNFSRYFKAMPKNDMLLLLSKLHLKENQANDIELVIELWSFQPFKLLKKAQGETSIKTLGGEITAKVHGSGRWEINHSEFIQMLRERVRQNLNSEYKFLFDKYEGKTPENPQAHEDKKYTSELKAMNCEVDEISEAQVDYWRMTSLICEANEINPLFNQEVFNIYKKDKLLPRLRNLKRINSMNKNDQSSLYNYRKSKELPHEEFKDIQASIYFQHGTMHNIVEDDDVDFSWIIT